ncbi:MAG TPA: zf-HC2 domain-containing protein [Chthonomonadaceae bacterium]|nr:zf-HC2 domain-containing protein [Chthonomonadaceae bacterium]
MLKRTDPIADPQGAGNASQDESVSGPFAVIPPIDVVELNGGQGEGNDACRLVLTNLSAYQDGELDPDQQRIVEAHLAKCTGCASNLDALRETDRLLQREWQESGPLPSSLETRQAIDSIMAALPPAPATPAQFAPKRVHSRARWMRFSTGLAGLLALISLMWSSYRIGYLHGRRSILNRSATLHSQLPQASEPTLTFVSFSPTAPAATPPLERRDPPPHPTP